MHEKACILLSLANTTDTSAKCLHSLTWGASSTPDEPYRYTVYTPVGKRCKHLIDAHSPCAFV